VVMSAILQLPALPAALQNPWSFSLRVENFGDIPTTGR
jgi:hypothetical protein